MGSAPAENLGVGAARARSRGGAPRRQLHAGAAWRPWGVSCEAAWPCQRRRRGDQRGDERAANRGGRQPGARVMRTGRACAQPPRRVPWAPQPPRRSPIVAQILVSGARPPASGVAVQRLVMGTACSAPLLESRGRRAAAAAAAPPSAKATMLRACRSMCGRRWYGLRGPEGLAARWSAEKASRRSRRRDSGRRGQEKQAQQDQMRPRNDGRQRQAKGRRRAAAAAAAAGRRASELRPRRAAMPLLPQLHAADEPRAAGPTRLLPQRAQLRMARQHAPAAAARSQRAPPDWMVNPRRAATSSPPPSPTPARNCARRQKLYVTARRNARASTDIVQFDWLTTNAPAQSSARSHHGPAQQPARLHRCRAQGLPAQHNHQCFARTRTH